MANFYDTPINKYLELKLEKLLMDHEIIKENNGIYWDGYHAEDAGNYWYNEE